MSLIYFKLQLLHVTLELLNIKIERRKILALVNDNFSSYLIVCSLFRLRILDKGQISFLCYLVAHRMKFVTFSILKKKKKQFNLNSCNLYF